MPWSRPWHRVANSAVIAGIAFVSAAAAADDRLHEADWFDYEDVADPQIAPTGGNIVYVRRFHDVMTDRQYGNLWQVNADGSGHRPLTTGKYGDSSPRWSHDGQRIAFISDRDGGSNIFVLYLDDGRMLQATRTPHAVSDLAWSPDDAWIAFSMPVDAEPPKEVEMPKKPEGAEWADPPAIIDKLIYRFDRRGYLDHTYQHVFVVPSLGGTPRKLTDGDWDHGGPSWLGLQVQQAIT